MAKSWKDVTPSDPEWALKLKLEKQLSQLRLCGVIAMAVFLIALVVCRLVVHR